MNNQINKKENTKVLRFDIILLFFFLISLLPFFYTMLYATPSPDDFAMASVDSGRNLFLESIRLAIEYWFGWVGMWFASFYETLFNPLNLFGNIRWLYGLVMCCIFCFFLFSVYFLVKTLVKDLLQIEDRRITVFLFVVTAFVLINIDIYFEIFAWFVGSHYGISVSLSFLFLALFIKYLRYSRGPVYMMLLSLLGMITCSNYMVAVAVGVAYYFILLFLSTNTEKSSGIFIKLRHVFDRRIIPLYFCIIGGVSAVLAPGNFSRNKSISVSSLSLWKTAIQNMMIAFLDFSTQLICNPLLFFGCILIMILGMKITRRKGLTFDKRRIIMIICFFLVPLIMLLPVAMGYGHHDFPNRIQFTFNAYAISAALVLAFHLGILIEEKYHPEKQMFHAAYISIFIGMYVAMVNQAYLADFPCVRMVRDRVITRTFGSGWFDILDEIKYSEAEDVVIIVPDDLLYLDLDPLTKSPGIADNPKDGANVLVAQYYGKRSVTVLSDKQSPAPEED
ncbi:MAG: hypothetical protein K5989_07215 [Lachnospiraceae bacterium]|nr:hypothetical protein [Lachnospiraceae bacterium]